MTRAAKGGDKINRGISATVWNGLRSQYERNATRQNSVLGGTAPEGAQDGIVMLRNDTGLYLNPNNIVGLDVPFVTPDAPYGNDFQLAMNFKGVIPTDGTSSTTDYRGRFGIVLDGSSPGSGLVPTLIHGLAWCPIRMNAATDAFADVLHNSTERLSSGSSGAAQILYAHPAGSTYPQDTVAYVRLGNKGAASLRAIELYYSGSHSLGTSWAIVPYDSASYQEDVTDLYEWDATSPQGAIYVKQTGLYLVYYSAALYYPGFYANANMAVFVNDGAHPKQGSMRWASFSNRTLYWNIDGIAYFALAPSGTLTTVVAQNRASIVWCGIHEITDVPAGGERLEIRAKHQTDGGASNVTIETDEDGFDPHKELVPEFGIIKLA